MSARRITSTLAAAALAGTAALATAPMAQAHTSRPTALGTSSLAALLAKDGNRFDRNWYDFDIVDAAVHAVLAAKPKSPVGVLANGKVPLTAFLPNDRAFQMLALDLTHHWYPTERGVFTALAKKLGVNTIEAVLLYHVVPGVTIDSATALKSNGARLNTALPGASFRVQVLSHRPVWVRLIDNDRDAADPWLVRSKLDLNKGNRQIAHGISLVLRPVDL